MIDRPTWFCAAALSLAWSASATAQSTAVIPPGGQITRDAATVHGSARGIDQVSSKAERTDERKAAEVGPASTSEVAVAQPARAATREKSGTAQVSASSDARHGTAQLTSTRRTAEPASAISKPSEGRRQAVVRLAGKDRCDPATTASESPACARLIENRSQEYVRPDPNPLSPEQRLLVDQRIREAPGGPEQAVQRLGRNDVNPDSSGDQGLASIVLRNTDSPAKQTSTPEPAPAETAGAALVQAITAGNPTGTTSGTGAVPINPK